MKITKILGLLVIFVALISLVGCGELGDQILEIWFEDDLAGHIGGGDGGDNGIGVWVEIEIPGDVDSSSINPQIGARVEAVRAPREFTVMQTGTEEGFTTSNFVWPNWDWNDAGDPILTGYVELYGIPDGTAEEPAEYKVIVWLERTQGEGHPNGDFDPNEPRIDASYERTDEGGNTFYDNIFRFPNKAQSGWVEAEAYLQYFEGGDEFVNYDYKVLGEFVVDVFDTTATTQRYEVAPFDTGLEFDRIEWNIIDRNSWEWIAGGDATSNQSIFPEFDVDISNLGTEERDFWLEIIVFFVDGPGQPKKLPLRKVDEAPNNVDFPLYLDIWGAAYEPWNFSTTESYTVWSRIKKSDGTIAIDFPPFDASLNEYGDFAFDFEYLSYNASGGGLDGIDRLIIVIDADKNGERSPGDARLVSPIILSTFEANLEPVGNTFIWFEGWDLQPYYAPPPE